MLLWIFFEFFDCPFGESNKVSLRKAMKVIESIICNTIKRTEAGAYEIRLK